MAKNNHYKKKNEVSRREINRNFPQNIDDVIKREESRLKELVYFKDARTGSIAGDTDTKKVKEVLDKLKCRTSVCESVCIGRTAVKAQDDPLRQLKNDEKIKPGYEQLTVDKGTWLFYAMDDCLERYEKLSKNDTRNDYLSAFKAEAGNILPILPKRSLSDEEFFLNTVKLYILFMASGYNLNINNGDSVNIYEICNTSVEFFGYEHEPAKIADLSRILIDSYPVNDINFGTIDKAVLRILDEAIQKELTAYIMDRTNTVINETLDKEESAVFDAIHEAVMRSYVERGDSAAILNIFYHVVKRSTKIVIETLTPKEKADTAGGDIVIKELESQIAELSEKYEKEKKTADAYKQAFLSNGFYDLCEQKTDESEELKKKVTMLNNALTESDRANTKLAEKMMKLEEENKSLQEEINLILPESMERKEPEENIRLKDVDYTKKYAFVMQNPQQLELEGELKEMFPNSVIAKKTSQINASFDLVIFITEFLSHSMYGAIKKLCKDMGVSYIHCGNMNAEKIRHSIWEWENTR